MTSHSSREPLPSSEAVMKLGARAQVMLLGTFHFRTAGLDRHNITVDMMTPARQAEIEAVVARLAGFRPTKIAVEAQVDHERQLREEFQQYRSGSFALPANELYQLGFRLAARLGHDQVCPIDAWDRHYGTEEQFMAYVRARGYSEEKVEDLLIEPHWWERYSQVIRQEEQVIATRPLWESLLYLNGEEQIRIGHGAYLAWADGEPGDYTLVDYRSGWFNRNLRIFANLRRITESPADRILVIYGAGHLPLLRHAVQSSYQHQLVEVAHYLGDG